MEEHCSLNRGLFRPPEVVRRAAGGCHVQRALASEIACVEDLKEIKLAAAGRPARAFRIRPVL